MGVELRVDCGYNCNHIAFVQPVIGSGVTAICVPLFILEKKVELTVVFSALIHLSCLSCLSLSLSLARARSHCVHVDDALIVDVLSVCGRRLRALRLVGCGKVRYIRQK